MHRPPIRIHLRKGTIDTIRDLPRGCVIEVYDYDLGDTAAKEQIYSDPAKHTRTQWFMMANSPHNPETLHREVQHHEEDESDHPLV